MSTQRRALLVGLGATAVLGRAALAQRSEPWPSRPIRLVLGFAPGGVGDITARLVAPKIGEALGQTVVIDNRPGAAGIPAAENVLRSPPDGYTLLLLTTSNTTARALYHAATYDIARDFTPVGRIATFDHAFYTGAASPYRTLQDVLADARARPGAVNLGSISVGSGQHLGSQLLRTMTGADMTLVPYRSTPDLMNAVTSGDVQIANEVLAPLLPQVLGGRLRLLAICSTKRFPSLPQVPTVIESGVTGYEVEGFNGVAAPAGTPANIVERLGQEIVKAVNLPEISSRLLELGVRPEPLGPAQFGAFVQSETARWGKVIAEAGIPRQ